MTNVYEDICNYIENYNFENIDHNENISILNVLKLNPYILIKKENDNLNILEFILFFWNKNNIKKLFYLLKKLNIKLRTRFLYTLLQFLFFYNETNNISLGTEIIQYTFEIKFFNFKNHLSKYISYFSFDSVYNNLENLLQDNIHFISDGMTILLHCFNNIPLFNKLLQDSVNKNLYDLNTNKNFTYYINNENLITNIDYELSYHYKKFHYWRTFCKCTFSKEKIEYLKDIFNLSYYVSTDNFINLDKIFSKYKNSKYFKLDPNTRIENNKSLIYFATSLQMIDYLIKNGANINLITSVDVINNIDFCYLKKRIFKSNILYSSIFMFDNFDHYYLLGLDFKVSKKAIIKTIKHLKNYNKLQDDNTYIIKLYIRLLNLSNKYIKKQEKFIKKYLYIYNFNEDEIFSIISYL